MNKSNNLNQFTEFETKYKIDHHLFFTFKKLISSEDMENELGEYKFIYAEGPDYYYTKPDGSFLRYRKAINDKKSWVTMKEKPDGASHNIKRKEVNWRTDFNDFDTINEGALMQGYDYNFKIYKICHIYKFKEATFVYYSVEDDSGDFVNFVEIELDEDTIHNLTEKEAWEKIKRLEKFLEPLNITYKNRLSKSLFEMYYKDIYSNNEALSARSQ